MNWPKSRDASTANDMCVACEKCADGRRCTWAHNLTPPDRSIVEPIYRHGEQYTWRILRCPLFQPDGQPQITEKEYTDSIIPLIDNLWEGFAEEREERKKKTYLLSKALILLKYINENLPCRGNVNKEILSRAGQLLEELNSDIEYDLESDSVMEDINDCAD